MNKVLVTGSFGFIGKHISKALIDNGYDVLSYDKGNSINELKEDLKICDYIIILAGINRPKEDENYLFNFDHVEEITYYLKKNNRNVPIIFSSSIQASLNNDYGVSKRFAEQLLFESGLPVYVYRLANAFGKWCRPNYNSACATFCYNIANEMDITISDRNNIVKYNYIDDICDEFIKCIKGIVKPSKDILYISPTYEISLGELVDTLYRFKKDIESDKHIPDIHNDFELKLLETFTDYLSIPNQHFNYSKNELGSFKEIYKSDKYGQISINTINPNVTKGNHYHTYKKEIFMTVLGHTIVKQRKVGDKDIIIDDNHSVPNIPINIKTGYTHNIKNVGKEISITLMWISHIYKEETADTYKEDVE